MRRLHAMTGALALVLGLVWSRSASAEITLVKSDKWELYTAGRVNAFLTYGFGDAFPVGTHNLIGGGVDTATDLIPRLDAMGQPDTNQQGTVSKMRLRSGFVPNVLALGVRRSLNESTTIKAQMSIQGTIETAGQRKYLPIITDFIEGYLEVAGPWGTFTGGRFLSLFSRGITQIDFLYGHGYGVGFSGGQGFYNPGPTAGLIGFGVLAASFSPGLMYTTPSLAGLQLAVGVFDPVQLAGAWESARTARPEAELTYDLSSGSFKMHLFANGAYQKVYRPGTTDNDTAKGVGYGGRFELGPMHLGGGGHYGKGLGLYFALEGTPADHAGPWDPVFNEFRTIDGYSVFAQYAAGPVDFNVAYGISQVHLLDVDRTLGAMANESVIKSQTGISAGIVFHASDSLHLDVDYLNARFAWYAGEKQRINYINTGATMTW